MINKWKIGHKTWYMYLHTCTSTQLAEKLENLLNVFIEYPDTINTLLTIRSNNQQLYIYILSYSIDKIHLHCCILKTRLYIVGQLTILYKI